MSNDKIDDLFKQGTPAASAEAKDRAKAAALHAFREAQNNSGKKLQENTDSARPTRTSSNEKDMKMKQTHFPYWASGLAASVFLAVGAIVLLPANKHYPEISGDLSRPDIQLNLPAAQPANKKMEYDTVAEEEVIVHGIRASLPEAIPTKREATQFVDAIRSEDVGQLPNASIAESLQRTQGIVLNDNRALVKAAPMLADSLPQHAEEYRDRFEDFHENPVTQTQSNPVSTFSIDVDTASYSFVRRRLNSGYLPQQNAVRIEEFINYFDYDYPLPTDKSAPFKPSIVVSDSPWKNGNKLIHIGIKGYQLQTATQPDSNIVFLLDVSGSMNSADKLPLVKQSMALLLSTLKPSDTISIVVYAGAAGTVLEPTPVAEKQTILAALQRLQAGGSTAGAQGLALAYQQAETNFKEGALNRVILATDGDFNVGITQDERLEDFVARKRDAGIYLSVLGFGQGNYQDAMMQTLAQNGNGVAAYIDTLSEAQKVLVNEATSSLFPIANDVKIQVEFNPETVSEYRLIGYETRALKREDFNNDKVDAGEIGAGHSVTAIYEVTPTGSGSALIEDLRYSENKKTASNSSEYGYLRLRYKLPGETESLLIEEAISTSPQNPSRKLQQDINFASAVAGFAQLLRGGKYTGKYNYDDVIAQAQANKGSDNFGYRTEFIQLVRKAQTAKP